jgi:hypothetical protein
MVAGGSKPPPEPTSTLSRWNVHSTTPSPKFANVDTESCASIIAWKLPRYSSIGIL